jgi:hypothetical protein
MLSCDLLITRSDMGGGGSSPVDIEDIEVTLLPPSLALDFTVTKPANNSETRALHRNTSSLFKVNVLRNG